MTCTERRPEPIPLLASVAALAPRFDAWICDIWGVLHNGLEAFAAAGEACRRFRQRRGIVLLLSNSPRPSGAVARQLDGLGVPRDAYDAIVTSGDLTRTLLQENPERRLLHIGPERDKVIFAGLEVRFAAEDEADLVICSGLVDDDRETPNDYLPLLTRLAQRRVAMICANPDLTVERGARLVYCAGSLAAEYERLGGAVTYAGKPHAPAYRRAFERIAEIRGAPVPRARILAIGDVIRTDIRGAARAGLGSLFVGSAIHVEGPLDERQLAGLFDGSDVRPIAALAALKW